MSKFKTMRGRLLRAIIPQIKMLEQEGKELREENKILRSDIGILIEEPPTTLRRIEVEAKWDFIYSRERAMTYGVNKASMQEAMSDAIWRANNHIPILTNPKHHTE